MNIGSIEEIISLFRKEHVSRPILLLGAGASFKSGVPLANDSVKRIAKASYTTNKGQHWKNYDRVNTSEWEPYLKSKPWYKEFQKNLAEAFPTAVEKLLQPKEFRKEFLLDILEPKIPISNGYYALASIIEKNLCWTILTTNFDTLIYDSFKSKVPTKKIFEINKTSEGLNAFKIYGQRQIVYLHGALEYYTDKVERGETKKLNENLITKLRPCLDNGPLIVVGYRGAEESIMKHLLTEGIEHCNNYSNGIFWCILNDEEPHSYVTDLASSIGGNFKLIRIEGFDELMERLASELENEYFMNTETQLNLDSALLFDEKILEDKTFEDLDENLIKVTLSKYFERLLVSSVKSENYIDFLIAEHFLVKRNGKIHPTNACYLLFGKNISDKFPYAVIKFEINGKSRTMFDGNLLEQYSKLQDYFDNENINPIIRIKIGKESFDQEAYQPSAIRELLVNMIVHRDYEIEEFNKIEYKTGEGINFVSSGGLPQEVLQKVKVDPNGLFEPIRGLSYIRNRLIADIFYGIGSMDKVGSGMPDVKEYMRENGGEAQFKISENNKTLCSTLLQAIQTNPNYDNIAKPITKTELFITNLLPFRVLPKTIYLFPTFNYLSFIQIVKKLPKGDTLPLFITDIHNNVLNKKIISFAHLEFYKEYFEDVIDFAKAEEVEVSEFTKDLDKRKRLSWLILKHFEFYLKSFSKYGLRIEYKDRKAYFELVSGIENKITYLSRLNRKTTRAVVKRRETKTRVYHENEGISFGLEYLGNQFSLSIKPIYVFTQQDGKTPLQSYLRSRFTTSRMKFDRNKNVDDDLHFWLKLISQGSSSINMGGFEVDDLILDSKYIENEVVVEEEN